MSTLTIRLSDTLRRELALFSKQSGKSAGDIVRESLIQYLVVERFHALRGKTLPFAEAARVLVDEELC
jgi:hypothetical protein